MNSDETDKIVVSMDFIVGYNAFGIKIEKKCKEILQLPLWAVVFWAHTVDL